MRTAVAPIASGAPLAAGLLADAAGFAAAAGFLARIMREHTRTLTPTLSLSEGEGVISMPSPPQGVNDPR